MKRKVKDIPVRDLLLPTVGDVPFDVRRLPFGSDDYRKVNPNEVPHRHQFYEIIHITGGRDVHYIDFESYRLQEDTLCFVSPGQVHFHDFNSGLCGHLILFNSDFLIMPPENNKPIYEIAFFHRVRETPVLRLKKDQAAGIHGLVRSIYDEYHSEKRDRVSLLRAYLHILIVQAQRLYDMTPAQDGSKGESSLMRRFMGLVSRNYASERSVKAYADLLGINANHLSDTVRALMGRSPGWLIRRQIVLEAKRLLAVTDLTVAEIGYAMNFEDPSYFSRFLKRETGLSPSQLRRNIREKYHLSRE